VAVGHVAPTASELNIQIRPHTPPEGTTAVYSGLRSCRRRSTEPTLPDGGPPYQPTPTWNERPLHLLQRWWWPFVTILPRRAGTTCYSCPQRKHFT